MESEWSWDRLDPLERKVADLLVQGRSNAAICVEVFHSRARVQECIKRILIKTGAHSTRAAIAILVEERETLSLLRVLDQASDGVAIVQDRLLKFVNRALGSILGYDPEELEGVPFVELAAPRSRDAQAERYDLRMKGEPFLGSYVVRAVCKGGQEKDLIITIGGLIQFRGRPAILGIAVPPAERRSDRH